jgi:hypothetical protein
MSGTQAVSAAEIKLARDPASCFQLTSIHGCQPTAALWMIFAATGALDSSHATKKHLEFLLMELFEQFRRLSLGS